jgi:DNA-binding transcriptional LysR family regulator
MKFRHLEYFVAAAEELNFTHAADRLHVSQPPFSKQIHDLEGELGIDLLARQRKGVALTPAGKSFLIDAIFASSFLRTQPWSGSMRLVRRPVSGWLKRR